MSTALSTLNGDRPRRSGSRTRGRSPGRGIGYPTAILLSLPLLAGAWMVHQGVHSPTPPPQPSRADRFSTAPAVPPPGGPQLPASAPVRIRIPQIGVNAPVTAVHLNPDGTLGTPPENNRDLAGWYSEGTAPGAPGNAIIVGHVDTYHGPAVFWALGALHRGGQVDVRRADDRTAVFTVDAIAVYPKSSFPSARVYGRTARPELRLITCGGGYSARRGYLGNVVVYAHLTAVR